MATLRAGAIIMVFYQRWLLAVLLVILLSGLAPVSPAAADACLKSVAGEAWIMGAAARRPALAGAMVRAGEKIITGATGRVTARLADASTLIIPAYTIVRIDRSRAATTAVTLRLGELRMLSSQYRWPGETIQVTTPLATLGIRGTVFDVGVAASGEARVYVDTGVVFTDLVEIRAGEAAAVEYDTTMPAAADTAPGSSMALWRSGRQAALAENRTRIIEAVGKLLREALGLRLRAGGEVLRIFRDIGNAMKMPGEEGSRAWLEKVSRVIVVARDGLERARTILASDREAQLREELLREMLAAGELPPGAAAFGKRVLQAAEQDRAKRDRDIANLDKLADNLGAATAFLAAAAATDPAADRVASRIIIDGLGLPLHATPITGRAIVITRPDLDLVAGDSAVLMRTVRGRQEFRVPVAVTVAADAGGRWISMAPDAFDTPVSYHVYSSDTAIWSDSFAGLAQVTRARPALLYRFPLQAGDNWVVWHPPAPFANINRIERSVTAQERIRTAAGEYDCLRVETRLRSGRNQRGLLLTTEWITPGAGVVRSLTFRGELQSVAFDELLPPGPPAAAH